MAKTIKDFSDYAISTVANMLQNKSGIGCFFESLTDEVREVTEYATWCGYDVQTEQVYKPESTLGGARGWYTVVYLFN